MTQIENRLEQYRRYLGVIRDRKWWVVAIWVPVFLLSLGIAFVLPATYSSSTMILVERQKIPTAYVRPTVTDTMQERLKTITQQILSRTRISQIIGEYDLTHEATPTERVLVRLKLDDNPLIQRWGRRLHLLRDPNATPKLDSAIRAFQGRVKVKVVGSEAFSVGYSGYDPVTVMRVTNAIADMFITQNLKLREAQAEGTTEFLGSQLEAARRSLEEKEAAVQKFKADNLGALPEQLDANLRTLDRLQLELQHADESLTRLAEQKTFVQRQMISVKQQLADMSDDARLNLRQQGPLDRQLAAAEARLTQLKSKYTDKFPEVVSTKAQIASLKEQIAAHEQAQGDQPEAAPVPVLVDLQNQLTQIERDAEKLRATKERREKDLQTYKARVENTPGVEQGLQKLSRDYGIMQRNYQSLLEKQMNAKLAQSLERRQKGEQFLIIDPANLPTKPDGPHRRLIALVGLLGGLGLGIGAVIGLDEVRPRFRTSGDVSAILGLPVLTVVPRIREMERGS